VAAEGFSSQEGRANSRDALVEAAFEEFTTKGYEAATVAGIAKRAGVTTGAVYAHFAGKLDLLLAAVGLTPLADLVRPAELGAMRPRAMVELLSRGLSSQPDRRRLLLLDVIVAARRDPEVAAILRGGLESYVRGTARAFDTPEDTSRLLAVLNLGMIVFAALDARTPATTTFEHVLEGVLQPKSSESAEPASLDRVRARAAALARARAELDSSISDAVENGYSLRTVGAAVGISHEAVRQIATRS
jgi:AcrR family transcriptional regulator